MVVRVSPKLSDTSVPYVLVVCAQSVENCFFEIIFVWFGLVLGERSLFAFFARPRIWHRQNKEDSVFALRERFGCCSVPKNLNVALESSPLLRSSILLAATDAGFAHRGDG